MHHVGDVDEPVRALAGWSIGDLRIVDHDIQLTHDAVIAAALGKPSPRDAGGRFVAFGDLPALLDLPTDGLSTYSNFRRFDAKPGLVIR